MGIKTKQQACLYTDLSIDYTVSKYKKVQGCNF